MVVSEGGEEEERLRLMNTITVNIVSDFKTLTFIFNLLDDIHMFDAEFFLYLYGQQSISFMRTSENSYCKTFKSFYYWIFNY